VSRRTARRPGNASLGIETNHSAGVRVGEMIFVGGQADIGAGGTVRHPGDLTAQTDAAVDAVEAVLAELGADIEDVTKLVVFYASNGEVDESAYLGRLRERFRGEPAPACMALPLPALGYPDMLVEIECIAMRGADGGRLPRQAANPVDHWPWPFSHGIRCGQMLFVGAQSPFDRAGALRAPGEVVEQAKINIDNIATVMTELGADLNDVCRFNTFYVGYGTAEDWKQAGRIRGNAFERPGVCGTGVPVPMLYPEGLTIRQEATGMLGLDGSRLPRTPSLPEGHWGWPIPVKAQQGVRIGNMIMIGGQVSADASSKAVHPDDLAAQTRRTMDFVQRVVEDLGGTMDDVVKINAFYKDAAGADAQRLHTNLAVRSEYFSKPGPVSTGVPLKALGMEHMDIEIEGYAILDE
jgi:enamine deaminase RidA (YjgF/YER057c/UK114 family)